MDSRIKEAAKALDEAKPGWANNINIIILDQSDSTCCVLGQTYGYYNKAPGSLKDGNHEWAFDGGSTEEWMEVVKERVKTNSINTNQLNEINSWEEFVAYRNKLNDYDVTVTIPASVIKAYFDGDGEDGASLMINDIFGDALVDQAPKGR